MFRVALRQKTSAQRASSAFPRFNGDPATLPEYTYRVMARLEKEGKMAKDEVQKLGPLGLRLVEGLRGPALRLAQQVDIKALEARMAPKLC